MTAPPGDATGSGRRHGAGRLRRWRSLRGRAALAFTALAALLTAVTSTGVWLTVSQYLLLQRERVTTAQSLANADRLQRGLRTEGLSAPQLLAQLPRETGSTSLLVDGGQWFTTSLRVGRDDLPLPLRRAALRGEASHQRIQLGGHTVLAVGVPLQGEGRAYFEVFPLDELDETYRTLGTVLLVAGAVVPVLALGLGWWLTRPALRPIDRVGAAAAAIASGQLDARIDHHGDPDLVPLATSFNRTAAALERRVRADARFASDVAHELRTPLTAMLGALSLVEQHRERLPGTGREALDLLQEEVDRFSRLVQDLLEISRSDAGSHDLVLEEVDLADFVCQALPEHAHPLVTRGPDGDGLVVRTDKRRLRQVVANLVDNADKHGGGLTRVTVARVGRNAEVLVDDAGPGVDPAERERIFERFARARGSASSSSEGAGLGLSLVERHLQLLGGSVTVVDSPEGGARFRVLLPLEVAPWRR